MNKFSSVSAIGCAATLLGLIGCGAPAADSESVSTVSEAVVLPRVHQEIIDPQDGMFVTYWERDQDDDTEDDVYEAGFAQMDLVPNGYTTYVDNTGLGSRSNFVVGKGYDRCWGETVAWETVGTQDVHHLGLYGWFREPLVEYYIGKPRGDGDRIAGVYSTSKGHYALNVRTMEQSNILNPNDKEELWLKFLQFNCQSLDGVSSQEGPVDLTEHFRAWEKLMTEWWPNQTDWIADGYTWYPTLSPNYCAVGTEIYGPTVGSSNVANIQIDHHVTGVSRRLFHAQNDNTNVDSDIRSFDHTGASSSPFPTAAWDLAVGELDGDPTTEEAMVMMSNGQGFRWLRGGAFEFPPFVNGTGNESDDVIEVADIDGDGKHELVWAQFPFTGPFASIRVFDLAASTAEEAEVTDSAIPSTDFQQIGRGEHLVSCDLDGDGKDEIIKVGGSIKIYKAGSPPSDITVEYLSGSSPFFERGNTKGACADLNNDGLDDLIVAQGAVFPGTEPPCMQFYTHPFAEKPLPTEFQELGEATPLSGCLTYDDLFYEGTDIVAGDLNQDGFAEIVVGRGGNRVRIFHSVGHPLPPVFPAPEDHPFPSHLAIGRKPVITTTPPVCQPDDTVCDGIDSDCNGVADDGYVATVKACPGFEGCLDSTYTCVSGGVVRTPECPAPAVCTLPADHPTCPGAAGRMGCAGGAVACVPNVAAVADDCDGVDNDCDGAIDEDFAPTTSNCGTEVGICQDTSTTACIDGVLSPGVCGGGAEPTTEVPCNGLDDDCDASTDEGSVLVDGVCVEDADTDGIADDVDTDPDSASSSFDEAQSFEWTEGEIVTRGDQTVYIYDLDAPEGVRVQALPGGGALPAQISACNGAVLVTLSAGESETITCPRPTSCLFASEALTVFDRSNVVSDFHAGGFTVWHDAKIAGDARSLGNGQLWDRAEIMGDATLGGVLTGNRGGVHGTLSEGATVAPQALVEFPIASTGPNVEVAAGASTTLPPGDYGNVLVREDATLVLSSSGIYRFHSLEFEWDTRLDLSSATGRVVLAVEEDLTLGDRFVAMGDGELDIFVNGASVEVGDEALIAADLEAPFAAVTVRDRTQLSGCLGGRVVTLGHDVEFGDIEIEVPPPPPALSAWLTVTGNWASDYCVTVGVSNSGETTTGWLVTVKTNGSTIYDTWNGAFSGNSGTVTVTPNQSWNLTLDPGESDSSVGFCAHRFVPGAMATMVSVVPN